MSTLSPDNSALIVIDMQGRLAYLMEEKELLFRSIRGAIQLAYHLNIPVIYTEQVPDKIGPTIPEIKEMLYGRDPIVKKTFSCCGSPLFKEQLKSLRRRNLIITGIESHVCVYQTVSDLLTEGYQPHLAYDAISSRSTHTRQVAFDRMVQAGALPTTVEMLACELIKTSEHPKFKEILGLLKSST